jgi:hypothetical protein
MCASTPARRHIAIGERRPRRVEHGVGDRLGIRRAPASGEVSHPIAERAEVVRIARDGLREDLARRCAERDVIRERAIEAQLHEPWERVVDPGQRRGEVRIARLELGERHRRWRAVDDRLGVRGRL